MSIEGTRTSPKYNTGTLDANTSATLLEFKNTTEKVHAPAGLVGYIAAAGTFSVAIRFWNGTTYTTGLVYDSSATTTAKGGTASRLNVVSFNIVPPPFCEVVISDTSGASNAYEYNLFGVTV